MAFSVRSELKMSEETFDFVCTTCTQSNKTSEAIKYCVQCTGYYCQSCLEAHKMFLVLTNHTLMDVTQGNQPTRQQSRLPEFPTEQCNIHKGKVVDMYCEDHDVVGCYVCIAKDHKSCKEGHIHSVPDTIDTLIKMTDCKHIHSLLQDKMKSMQALSSSNNDRLQELTKAMIEALGEVNTCQKVLEAILHKISESSRKEIETVYQQLKKEVLIRKHAVDNTCEDLNTTHNSLIQSEGNRAQQFVCAKIAQVKIKYANDEKAKQEKSFYNDKTLSFTPNQSLMRYIKDCEGIGQVHQYGMQKKYNIKRCREITMKLSEDDDSKKISSYGCCITHDGQLIVTDLTNKKLKRIDVQNMSVVDYCTIDSYPRGVCCISKQEVAIACSLGNNKIQFVSIQNRLTPTGDIKMSHKCCGVAFKDDKLYVTDGQDTLYVYNMTGSLLKTFCHDNTGNKMFDHCRQISFDDKGNRMFVGDRKRGLVCFDGSCNYLSTIKDSELKGIDSACVDSRNNMFVVWYWSHNVVQFSESGKKLDVIAEQGDWLDKPCSVCFHKELNRLFVTMENSDVIKMYELE